MDFERTFALPTTNPITPAPHGPARSELLAPAGDGEALRAAVANGADAVYLGLSDFNARHRATNFTLAELPKTVEFLHDHNVRCYVAFNTLIFSDELEQAVLFAQTIAKAGVDAVIVQDLGLVRLLRQVAPQLPIHGSTQMTLTEPRGLQFVRNMGVDRFILARELSLADIQKIAQATDAPLEVFVHGALCVAYSGQCLTSESLGGRSANRGQCAQACRLPYELIVDGQPHDLGDRSYLLSPQDLAAHDLIPSLLQAGVASFKIEGRLKSAHYVAAATSVYRAALDAALDCQPFQPSPQQQADLTQSFSRGFTHGFLDGVNHQELVHGRFPKNRGQRIGTVQVIQPHSVIIQPDPDCPSTLQPGDGIVFDQGRPDQWEQGGRVFQVTPLYPPSSRLNASRSTPRLELTFGDGDINFQALNIGDIVWKTDDPAVRKRLEHSFARDKVIHRIPLHVTVSAQAGEPLVIQAGTADGKSVTVQSDQPLEAAIKHPLTLELFRLQWGRLGDTPFELGQVTLMHQGQKAEQLPVMAPKSLLNELRRQAVERLIQVRSAPPAPLPDGLKLLADLRAAVRSVAVGSSSSPAASPSLHVLVRSLEQLRAVAEWQGPASLRKPATVYCDFEDIRQYEQAMQIGREFGLSIGLTTLRIIKPGEEGLLRQIAACQPACVLVRNLTALDYLREQHPTLMLVGDHSLNVANELTAGLLIEAGLTRITPSYDLNWSQLQAMIRRLSPATCEIVIHQHMPMFHMEHCVFAAALSNGKDHRDCGRPCDRHRVELLDRTQVSHPLVADVGCRNTVYNGQAQSAGQFMAGMLALGLRQYRVELLRNEPEQIAPLLSRYARILLGQEDSRSALRQLQVLNQLGVTAGTLAYD